MEGKNYNEHIHMYMYMQYQNSNHKIICLNINYMYSGSPLSNNYGQWVLKSGVVLVN